MDENLVPYNKVIASTLGAAFSTILIYLIEVFSKTDLPGGVEISFTTILTFVTGYFVRERPSVGGALLNQAKKRK